MLQRAGSRETEEWVLVSRSPQSTSSHESSVSAGAGSPCWLDEALEQRH